MRKLAAAILFAAMGAVHAHAGDDRPGAYFGDREYADPFIWDGWFGDGGYRGRAYYVDTSPYRARRHWPFYKVHEHRWSVADDIASLARD